MTTRDRLIIVVVLAVAALGGFWFVAVAPKHKEAADLQAQTDAATRKLSDAQLARRPGAPRQGQLQRRLHAGGLAGQGGPQE
jgi:hypothetical protein